MPMMSRYSPRTLAASWRPVITSASVFILLRTMWTPSTFWAKAVTSSSESSSSTWPSIVTTPSLTFRATVRTPGNWTRRSSRVVRIPSALSFSSTWIGPVVALKTVPGSPLSGVGLLGSPSALAGAGLGTAGRPGIWAGAAGPEAANQATARARPRARPRHRPGFGSIDLLRSIGLAFGVGGGPAAIRSPPAGRVETSLNEQTTRREGPGLERAGPSW